MSLISTIKGIFATKGVDFTIDDASTLMDAMNGAPQQPTNNLDISSILKDYDGINHNALS